MMPKASSWQCLQSASFSLVATIAELASAELASDRNGVLCIGTLVSHSHRLFVTPHEEIARVLRCANVDKFVIFDAEIDPSVDEISLVASAYAVKVQHAVHPPGESIGWVGADSQALAPTPARHDGTQKDSRRVTQAWKRGQFARMASRPMVLATSGPCSRLW